MDEMILNGLNDALVVIDSQYRIRKTNPAFDRWFGYDSQYTLDQDVCLLTDPDDYVQLRNAIHTAWWTRKPQTLQMVLIGSGGRQLDADIAVSHIAHELGYFALSIRDISHLREQAEKKDLFISMASHELRSLVGSSMLTLEMLLTYYDRITDEQRRQKLQHIRQQVLSMAEMVNSVLDVTQFDMQTHAHGDQISMIETLEDVIGELQPTAESRAQKIIPLIGDVSLNIKGDVADIKRIWRNLIGNALKYSRIGQSVEVGLYRSTPANDEEWRRTNFPLDLSCVKLPDIFRTTECVLGIVKDYGHGMRREDIPRLFNRFYRGWAAATDIPGTGLGLSLVRDILRAYDGDIMVFSQEGEGSTFCFWLPIDDTKAPQSSAEISLSSASTQDESVVGS